MKKIWIINQYNMPPEYGHLNRHYNLGKYLKRMGYTPTVFVGSFLHNTKRQMIEDGSIYKKYKKSEYPYFFVKTCDYSKSKFKRVFAMFEFYRNLFKTTRHMEKPDVIIGSSAHPLAAIAAIRLAKKYKCQSIVEVRDLWPESFVAYNIIKRNNPILHLLYFGEKWIYKKADKLIFTMEGGKDYIIEKGWDKEHGGPVDLEKVHHINNGVDIEVFEYNKEHYTMEDNDLNDKFTFKVIYTGSIRKANNLEIIINAAKYVKENTNKKIKFLIYGDGDERERLEEKCRKENITNVIFKGSVDKKFIPYIVSKSELNILNYSNHDIWKYGGSQNKSFEYLAAGKPILSTITMGYDIIKKYGVGISLDKQSPESIGASIIKMLLMPHNEYENISSNAREIAKNYDFKVLTEKLVNIFEA